MKLPSNASAPHRAVLFVRAEVHEVTPRNECSGRALERVAEFPLAIDGADRSICIRKMNEVLEALKKACKN